MFNFPTFRLIQQSFSMKNLHNRLTFYTSQNVHHCTSVISTLYQSFQHHIISHCTSVISTLHQSFQHYISHFIITSVISHYASVISTLHQSFQYYISHLNITSVISHYTSVISTFYISRNVGN